MPIETPFDRRLRRLRRQRAASRFAAADYLHRRAADELIERLDSIKRKFRDALILGPASGYLAHRLRERDLRPVIADAGPHPDWNGPFVQCDEDMLPFRDGAFDLAISVGSLDTVNDLPGALTLIRRSLRPDGLLLAAMAGGGTLPLLRTAMLAADEVQGGAASPRLHPQVDVRSAGDLLTRAGFTLPVADTDTVTVRFSGLPSLVADLRAMGATNLLEARSRVPLGRTALAAAMASFAASADPDGKIPERFELLYLTAWAPAPDQPKPARRGSATASLAGALKRS